jgi:hypothetical protein
VLYSYSPISLRASTDFRGENTFYTHAHHHL